MTDIRDGFEPIEISPAKIVPESLIPELVEWLMGEDTGADVAIQFWAVEEFITAEYDKRPMREWKDMCINNPHMDDLRPTLTAALEAFNERGATA